MSYELRFSDGKSVSLWRGIEVPPGRLGRLFRRPPRVEMTLLGSYELRAPYTFQWERRLDGGATLDLEIHGMDLLSELAREQFVTDRFQKALG